MGTEIAPAIAIPSESETLVAPMLNSLLSSDTCSTEIYFVDTGTCMYSKQTIFFERCRIVLRV